jgi:hypothetical protein
MVELEFQRDLLVAAIGAAKRHQGTSYQKFLFVRGHLGIVERQYRSASRYTYALYVRKLLSQVNHERSAMVVLAQIEATLALPPTSNTGVNSDVNLTLPLFEEV